MARRLSRRSLAAYVAEALTTRKSGDVVMELAAYLIENRRTKELDLIVKDVEYILTQQGVVSATVTSAFDLSTDTIKAIEALIVAQTQATTVALKKEVNPAVIGGVKITLPGYELDQTVAHQLTVLKTRFKKA